LLDEVAPKLKTGIRMLSETVRANAREGDIGTQLGEIAKANPDVAIGSYRSSTAERPEHQRGVAERAIRRSSPRPQGGRGHAGTACARAEERLNGRSDMNRRKLLQGALATAGLAGVSGTWLSRRHCAPTPECRDGDEPTVRQAMVPTSSRTRRNVFDLVERGTRERTVEISGVVLTRGAGGRTRVARFSGMPTSSATTNNKSFRYRGHLFTDADGRYRSAHRAGALSGRTRHSTCAGAGAGPARSFRTQLYFPKRTGNARDFLFRRELSDAHHRGWGWARRAVDFVSTCARTRGLRFQLGGLHGAADAATAASNNRRRSRFSRRLPVSWTNSTAMRARWCWRLAAPDVRAIVCVTAGGLWPAASWRATGHPLDRDGLVFSSYAYKQQGDLQVLKGVAQTSSPRRRRGKGVLIVDDLVDTGKTAARRARTAAQGAFRHRLCQAMGRRWSTLHHRGVAGHLDLFSWDTGLAFPAADPRHGRYSIEPTPTAAGGRRGPHAHGRRRGLGGARNLSDAPHSDAGRLPGVCVASSRDCSASDQGLRSPPVVVETAPARGAMIAANAVAKATPMATRADGGVRRGRINHHLYRRR